MKKTLKVLTLMMLMTVLAILTVPGLADSFTEFGAETFPRFLLTTFFSAAGNGSTQYVRDSYSKFNVYTVNRGVAATAQTITLQVSPDGINFFNAVTVSGTANAKGDTGTTPWIPKAVRVVAVITPAEPVSVGETPAATCRRGARRCC